MLGDLISRSKAIENIWSLYNSIYNDVTRFGREETELANRILCDVQKIIESMETAYDVDKVAKLIDGLEVKAIPRYKGGDFGDYEGTDYYVKKNKVLEIVKAGGVNENR